MVLTILPIVIPYWLVLLSTQHSLVFQVGVERATFQSIQRAEEEISVLVKRDITGEQGETRSSDEQYVMG